MEINKFGILEDIKEEIVEIEVDEPKFELKSIDNCNPLKFECDKRCRGSGVCFLNPYSECYNMDINKYLIYVEVKRKEYEEKSKNPI